MTRKLSPQLYRPKDKIYKMIWVFHKTDVDPFPSVPHGHSTSGKYKLKLWSGEVYDTHTNKQVGKANKKEMLILYRNNKFQSFVNDVREWFEQNNPYIPDLVLPEGRIILGKIGLKSISGRHKEGTGYSVVLSVQFSYSEEDS